VSQTVIYQDLTEIGQIGTPSVGGMRSILMREEPLVKTPAAIIYLACQEPGPTEVLVEHGWTNLRRTLNWHNWHAGDRQLDLWYKTFPFSTIVGPIPAWSRRYKKHCSSCYGCGSGYLEGFPSLNHYLAAPEAYLMLYRVLKSKLSPRKLGRFKDIHFSCVFQTDTAFYFANGFPPAKWKGLTWERKYWLRTRKYKGEIVFTENNS